MKTRTACSNDVQDEESKFVASYLILFSLDAAQRVHPLREVLNTLALGFGQRNAMLPLIFPSAILVRGFADFIAFKEEHLGASLSRIDFGG